MEQGAKIYVAGHRGLVGSAVIRRLKAHGYASPIVANRNGVDLTSRSQVHRFFAQQQPQYVILAAAKVGGIHANRSQPADFIRINLEIQTNVLHEAYEAGVRKLLFLGSSCIYPKHAPQPICEEHLLTGPLEPTNHAYAVAKIAGLIQCASYNQQHGTRFIAAMPTNLYGPGDNFDPMNSHVLPAMIRKLHAAKHAGHGAVTLWGSGTPRRELLYVDDLADACIFMLNNFEATPDAYFLNVGTGEDETVAELARRVQNVVGFKGDIVWDRSMPDGTPRKVLDITRIKRMGWQPTVSLDEGIARTYAWFLEHIA